MGGDDLHADWLGLAIDKAAVGAGAEAHNQVHLSRHLNIFTGLGTGFLEFKPDDWSAKVLASIPYLNVHEQSEGGADLADVNAERGQRLAQIIEAVGNGIV